MGSTLTRRPTIGRSRSAIALLMLATATHVLSGGAGHAAATGPQPTPTPAPQQSELTPVTGQEVSPQAGSMVLTSGGPCDGGAPGTLPLAARSSVHAAIIAADAGAPSDLIVQDPNQRTALANATSQVGATLAIGDYNIPGELVVGIYTPAFGSTRLSTSTSAKVKLESAGVWIVCFEDGSDGDYNDLIVRVWDALCSNQSLTELAPTNGSVRVLYDPRFVVEPSGADFLAQADRLANGIRDRANGALSKYRTMYTTFGANGQVPNQITIAVSCEMPPLVNSDAVTLETLIQLRASWIKTWMAGYAANGSSAADPGSPWADTIDHEVLHTAQYTAVGGAFPFLLRYWYNQNYTNFESTAALAQDWFDDRDDVVATTPPAQDTNDWSFLKTVSRFLTGHSPIITGTNDGFTPYNSAGFLQYVGERFGDASIPDLETRLAKFGQQVYTGNVGVQGIADAIAASPSDVLDVLRDFYVTLYARRAPNATTLPPEFRVLDETTDHGAAPNFGPPVNGRSWGDLGVEPVLTLPTSTNFSLDPTAGRVFEIAIPAGTALARITLTDNGIVPWPLHADPNDRAHLGFVAKSSSGAALIDANARALGPLASEQATYDIPVAGADKLAVVILGGLSGNNVDIAFEGIAGSASLTVDPIAPVAQNDPIAVHVHPAIAGAATGYQPVSAFSATVDGATAQVTGSFDLGAHQMLLVAPGTSLAPGGHSLAVTYRGATTTTPFTVTTAIPTPVAIAGLSVQPGPGGSPMGIRSVLRNGLSSLRGASLRASVTDPNGAVRRFPLADRGTPLDSAWNDGAYGAAAGGTTVAGTYSVTVEATGVDGNGAPFAVSSTTTVEVPAMVDGDGDGVADLVETTLGLDPTDPADGQTDLDGDGVGTASEIAAGLDPLSGDTDGGGEADGSERAAALDPLDADDDRLVTAVFLTSTAADGRAVTVAVGSRDSTSPVHLYRTGSAGTTDLGVHPGAGTTFSDGPLPAGVYRYHAVTTTAAGASSPPYFAAPIVVADDVTPPSGQLVVEQGDDLVSSTTVDVKAVDFDEIPAEMRFAESLEGLEAAAWQVFAAESTFNIGGVDGPHTIYAQFRDAAGNESWPVTDSVELDRTSPVSAAGPLALATLSSSVSVPFSASDNRALSSVEMWVRSRASQSSSWSGWSLTATTAASPVLYAFQAYGLYEFATVARDAAGNREPMPLVGDTGIRYGPEIVSNDTGTSNQDMPRAVTGRDGKVYAIWRDGRNSTTTTDAYFAARNSATLSWGANERVDDTSVAVTNPALAVDSQGNAYAVWVDARNGDKDIWFSKRNVATGIWSASVKVNDDAAGSVQDMPAIAVSATGEAIAVWVDGRSRRQAVYSARLSAGATQWSTNFKVSSDTALAKSAPDIAIGATGIAYAVWDQTKNGVASVRFTSLPSGSTTWAADVLLSDTTFSMGTARIAVDGAGNLLLTYQRGILTVISRRRPAGTTTWSTAITISSTGNVFSSSLAMRGNGVAYAVWKDGSDQLFGARFDPSAATWSAQQQITSTGTRREPSVALDTTGAVIVAADFGTNYDIRGYTQAVP